MSVTRCATRHHTILSSGYGRLLLCGLLIASINRACVADIVLEFSGDTSDERGGGPVLEALRLQNGNEAGSVNWDGSNDVTLGAATPQSETVSVQDLFDAGVTATDNGFDVIFVIDETGGIGETADFREFGIFTRAANGTLINGVDGFVGINGMGVLEQQFQGADNRGYIIDVIFTPIQWQLFIADPNNRIGMAAWVTDVDNGPEEFLIRRSSYPAAVPEPNSAFLLGLILFGAMISGKQKFVRRFAT